MRATGRKRPGPHRPLLRLRLTVPVTRRVPEGPNPDDQQDPRLRGSEVRPHRFGANGNRVATRRAAFPRRSLADLVGERLRREGRGGPRSAEPSHRQDVGRFPPTSSCQGSGLLEGARPVAPSSGTSSEKGKRCRPLGTRAGRDGMRPPVRVPRRTRLRSPSRSCPLQVGALWSRPFRASCIQRGRHSLPWLG